MQQEEGSRWFVEMIGEICREQSIALRLLSGNWLLELRKNDRTARILGYTFDLNSSVASSISKDKVATSELLAAYAIPAISHTLIRLHDAKKEWQALDWKDGVVVKPLTGLGGQHVRLFYDDKKAEEFMRNQRIEAWAVSPLRSIIEETRLIMLDGELLFAYGKQPVDIGNLKVFNLSKGAQPIASSPGKEYMELAKRTQEIIGLRVCAIDIVRLASGELTILEVNSGVTAQKYLQHNLDDKEEVRRMYARVVEAMFDKK
ncbi:MAG TPA: ATP-grasp domain-containing protein [Candidatus Saccharimonadales bacterium]|nr:ATP-grasp domain-containing protein [Candidatus Saccharimonadales bacterium]